MEKMKEGLQLIEGFIVFHQKLMLLGLKTGLATNADDDSFIVAKETLQLHTYFGDHMYNVTHVGKYKPDPALYLHASQQLGIDPRLCIAIEDSAHGVNAAKAAGMFCIGINTSKRLDQLNNADIIVNSYDEIDLEKLLSLVDKGT
jgi:haloacid dehalogenase superfamily, subfamily IA, variant 3 with third motif having DD or ED